MTAVLLGGGPGAGLPLGLSRWLRVGGAGLGVLEFGVWFLTCGVLPSCFCGDGLPGTAD